MDPQKLVFCLYLVEQAQVLQCQDRLPFPPSDRNVFIGTAASAENRHDALAVQSQVTARFQREPGQASKLHFLLRPLSPF